MSLWRTCKKHYIGRDTPCPVCRIAELAEELKRKSDMNQIMLANAANEKIEELEAQLKAYQLHFGFLGPLQRENILNGHTDNLLTEKEWKEALPMAQALEAGGE